MLLLLLLLLLNGDFSAKNLRRILTCVSLIFFFFKKNVKIIALLISKKSFLAMIAAYVAPWLDSTGNPNPRPLLKSVRYYCHITCCRCQFSTSYQVDLEEEEVYVAQAKMKARVSYPVKRLFLESSNYSNKDKAVMAHLRLADKVTGKFYLSDRYANHQMKRLTTERIDEIHKLMEGTPSVRYGTHAGFADVDLIHRSGANAPPYPLYDGRCFH